MYKLMLAGFISCSLMMLPVITHADETILCDYDFKCDKNDQRVICSWKEQRFIAYDYTGTIPMGVTAYSLNGITIDKSSRKGICFYGIGARDFQIRLYSKDKLKAGWDIKEHGEICTFGRKTCALIKEK